MSRSKHGVVLIVASLFLAFTVPIGTAMGKERPALLESVIENIDMDYAWQICYDLENMGTATDIYGESLGFRGAGSASSLEASLYVRDEMNDIGLSEVSLDEIPVDAWEFRGAWVDIPGIGKMQAASFGGSPGTDGEITAEIVNVGDGWKDDFEGLDVEGKIVLANWHKESWPNYVAMEAYNNGAVAVVLTTYDSLYGMQDGALQCHDGLYRPCYPPILSIPGSDGLAIIELLDNSESPVQATLWSDIVTTSRDEGGFGWNVVGYLPGKNWGTLDDEFVIIGDHTDAWFFGGTDNNAGVAGVLVLADAFKKTCDEFGEQPERTIIFVTHEAEEYGIVNTYYDWCWGAYYEITNHHPEWVGKTVAAMILDCVGFGGHRLAIEVNEELFSFTHKVAGQHMSDLPYGVEFHPISVWADHWTYEASGISSILFSDWTDDYCLNYYHSQYDTIDIIDFDYLRGVFVLAADMTHQFITLPIAPLNFGTVASDLYATMMMGNDKFSVPALYSIYDSYGFDPDANMGRTVSALEEFRVNAGILMSILEGFDDTVDPGIAREVNRLMMSVEVALGQSLVAMGVWEEHYYPYQQSSIDVKYLERGIEKLSASIIAGNEHKISDAMSSLSWVGVTWYYDYISEESYWDNYDLSYGTGMVSWGTQTHLLPAVDIWNEYDQLNQLPLNEDITAEDIDPIISGLRDVMVTQALPNLEQSFETMWTGLEEANLLIEEIIAL
ncbi:MAG: M28 family peptidase [Methanobacteriota archaeon]|nr:MAG: M28 family peptidase [Euryarchaeota archaeon]